MVISASVGSPTVQLAAIDIDDESLSDTVDFVIGGISVRFNSHIRSGARVYLFGTAGGGWTPAVIGLRRIRYQPSKHDPLALGRQVRNRVRGQKRLCVGVFEIDPVDGCYTPAVVQKRRGEPVLD